MMASLSQLICTNRPYKHTQTKQICIIVIISAFQRSGNLMASGLYPTKILKEIQIKQSALKDDN